MKNVLMLGCGRMGQAMLPHISGRLTVVDPTLSGMSKLVGYDGLASVHAQLTDALAEQEFDVIILAIKPQIAHEVIPHAAAVLRASSPLWISVMAGVRSARIAALVAGEEANSPATVPIIRLMPNTPALIEQGFTVGYANECVNTAQHSYATKLMAGLGEQAFIDDEAQMDAVTAVSGSGPAYLFALAEAMIAAAQAEGLAPELAVAMVKQTLQGASMLVHQLADSAPEIADLREGVTSPGGTTAAALAVLQGEQKPLDALMGAAIGAARLRAAEL